MQLVSMYSDIDAFTMEWNKFIVHDSWAISPFDST